MADIQEQVGIALGDASIRKGRGFDCFLRRY